MANRNLDQSWTFGKRIVEISGSFGTNAAGAIVASAVKGLGFGYSPVNGTMTLKSAASPGVSSTPGIVRTTNGTYTVTLEDPYQDLIVAACDLQVNAASANWAQPGPLTNTATAGVAPTITFFTINGTGNNIDVAQNTNSRVMFTLILRDSTVQYSKP